LLNQEAGLERGGLLPAVLGELCDELEEHADGSSITEDQPSPSITKVIDHPIHIELQAMQVSTEGPRNRKAHQVLIVLDFPCSKQTAITEATERFQLTKREQQTLERLIKGYTNKEIANELGVTEPTVKVFIKRLMEKMRCSTRTGIVSITLNGSAGTVASEEAGLENDLQAFLKAS
jgi:DNA-binding CsgD family transcriptional regulator